MKLLITEFISLDGVVQAPGSPEEDTDNGFAHGGWFMPYFDPEVMGGQFDQWAQQSDALLQGRRTYQASAGAWPTRSGDSFSDWINGVEKYVVSDTLQAEDIVWKPTTIIRSQELPTTLRDLKAKPGGYIYLYGSPSLTRTLLEADLVDDLLLTVIPIVIGSGKKLFGDLATPLTFTLQSSVTSRTGAIVNHYTRAQP